MQTKLEMKKLEQRLILEEINKFLSEHRKEILRNVEIRLRKIKRENSVSVK